MPIPPFRIERFFALREFEAPWLLCASDAESVTLDELLALEPDAREAMGRLWLGYTETRGEPGLRRDLAALYERARAEDVLVTSAAEEAVFATVAGLVGPGDHVVVHQPCYQSLAEVARWTGAEATPWRARRERGWAPDPEELRGLLRPDTRLVVVNFPHNPTGYLPPPELLREVVGLVEERGILLLCDEMYRFLEHDPEARLPAACDLSERAISLGGLSKSFGLPGLRLGWIACRDAEVLEKVAAFKDYTTICAPAPSEWLAALAVRNRDRLIGRNRELIAAHLPLLTRFFAEHEGLFEWVPPVAGPVTFPRLRSGDGDAFTETIYRETGVLLLPGSMFDEPAHLRIGFGRRNFPEALGRLEEWLVGVR